MKYSLKIALLFILVLAKQGLTNKILASPSYSVVNSGLPCINYQNNQSIFNYNYNPSYLPLFNADQTFNQSALMVRCQNATSQAFGVTPSKLSVSKYTYDSNFSLFNFSAIDEESIVFEPTSDLDNYGTEDPRIAYRQVDQTYYMFYTAAQQYSNQTVIARLALATTKTPLIKSSWVRHGAVFPNLGWSKSGALLLRDDFPGSPHYLIWGDSNLTLAYSYDLITFNNYEGFYLETRADNFDSQLVEAGPPPLLLSDGNYIFFYNSARSGFTSVKPGYDLQYNPGYIIIDSKNPQNILQRCSEPLISPTLAWQTGETPYLGLTPNVVFLEAAQSLGNDQFLVFYGAADSVVGSGLVTVNIQNNNINKKQYEVTFLRR